MKKGLLQVWQKKQLGDFFKCPASEWDFKNLLEHCKKEVSIISNVGYIAYYKEMARICEHKLKKA